MSGSLCLYVCDRVSSDGEKQYRYGHFFFAYFDERDDLLILKASLDVTT